MEYYIEEGEDMSKVSIIVPIYQVEKYLPKCLDSLIHQSFEDIEIILINDGSTDNCEKLCMQYMAKDQRIKYYYKSNGGLSSARNYGITKAVGEYFYFVDSDDYLETNTIEILYNIALNTGAELVVGGYRSIDQQTGNITTYLPTMPQNFYKLTEQATKTAFVDSLIQEKILIEVIWNKLYHRSIFSKILFPYRRFEDSFMCFDIYDSVKSIAFEEKTIYNYLVNRQGSISSSTQKLDLDRWDSLYIKAYSFYAKYPNLKFTNKYFYMCLKNILKALSVDSILITEIKPILLNQIKQLPVNDIGIINKLKILFRYR